MKNGGFTLIELLIVITITVVLALGGFFAFSGYKKGKDLEFTMNEVSSAVREVRQRSITQEDGEAWGVRFNSSSTGGDSYEIFYGTSYTATSVIGMFEFRRPVEFGEPSGGRTVDLEFEPITGEIESKKIISIAHKRDINETADILVNTLGKVTTRIESGIVGYWHFDEGTSTSTLDASGNDNTGELMNTPTWTATSDCKVGQCLSFNGTSNYIDVPASSIKEGNEITIEFWAKADSVKSNSVFWFEDSNGRVVNIHLLYNNGNTYWDAGVDGGGYDRIYKANPPGITGEWHHWAFTKNATEGTMKIYLDGEEWHSGTGKTKPITTPNVYSYIGRSPDYYFGGDIDEVRIYNVELASSTISAHYKDMK